MGNVEVVVVTGVVLAVQGIKYKIFVGLCVLEYFLLGLWLASGSEYEVVDVLGIRIDASSYLAVVCSCILVFFLYLGNILSLGLSNEIRANPELGVIINAVCYSVLCNNCLLVSFLFAGWNLYTAICVSSMLISVVQYRKIKISSAGLKQIVMKFVESCFQGFVFVMTGCSLATWLISVCSALFSYPFYIQIPSRSWLIELIHYLSVIFFSCILPHLLNPYHFSGVFYKLHANFHLI